MAEKEKQDNQRTWDFSQLKRIVIRDLNTNLSSYDSIYKNYDKEDIKMFLENPKKYEKQLREISNFLYDASTNYQNIIAYQAGMPLYAYTLSGLNMKNTKISKKKFLDIYKLILFEIENMNMKHEFFKIMKDVFKEGIFYGYVHSAEDSFYIQKLNPSHCEISTIEDGVWGFNFNVSSIQENKLGFFPKEIQDKYKIYKKDRKQRWQELDMDNTICIKYDENLHYTVPPFAGVFDAVVDIWDYKELKKAKTSINNYKLIGLEIPPLKDDKVDNLALSDEFVTQFMALINAALPPEIGAFPSPMKPIPIDFKEDNVNNDRVIEAINTFYNDAGVNQLLFNGDRSTGASLAMSIERDAEKAYGLLRQFERWVNRRLKSYNTKEYKFRLDFLNVTYFNRDKELERYMKLLMYGAPVIMPLMAILGYSPLQVINNSELEANILQLVDKFKPPLTSNVMSGKKKEPGRKEKDVEDLTEDGIDTRETDANNPDSRV